MLIHSDQGSQFTSMDWASFLKHHNLVHSMSRGGNCHDNAVAESFFNLLKRERIRRRVYRSRDEARQDVFDYIEMFYNPKRKHVRNGMLSPVEFEAAENQTRGCLRNSGLFTPDLSQADSGSAHGSNLLGRSGCCVRVQRCQLRRCRWAYCEQKMPGGSANPSSRSRYADHQCNVVGRIRSAA